MSTVAARKRLSRRKLKLSSGSSSRASSSLPSNMTANLTELFARLTMQGIPGFAGNTTEAAASKHCSKDDILATPETTNSIKHFDTKECEASGSLVVERETSLTAEDEVIVHEEPERKAPTESDVVGIVNQLREFLHDKDPSQEDDLMEALSPSRAQHILEAYGTLTAFLERRPGFQVVHEDLYSFVYYKQPDDEAAGVCKSLQDEATARSACYNDSGLQHSEACDGGPRRARVSSSSISTYESTIDEEDDEQGETRINDGCSQVPSKPSCMSSTLQAVQDTCDAEAQSQGWDPALFNELESTLRKCDAVAAELKGKLETLRKSHANEVQELRVYWISYSRRLHQNRRGVRRN
ncbi:hypothetical protein HPB49_020945 [Dermacentor silvarum]|uniref:Uncharacterized protein n=1 Tax=Dermacentor silvarum TaxID=543639 RepID=A0ACB8D814_DERSI|nr:hypothetical protein HPB49_020945 [Dermacentor silvarum]